MNLNSREHWLLAAALVLPFALTACTSEPDKPAPGLSRPGPGTASVEVIPQGVAAAAITGVTIEIDPGDRIEPLAYNSGSGAFSGIFTLDVGTYAFTARAYAAGGVLIGAGSAAGVSITDGATTLVSITILDTTGGNPQPPAGPSILSLIISNVRPIKGDVVSMTVVAVDPDAEPAPLAYTWTDTCPDADFTLPGAATTNWSKPTSGICDITIEVTDGLLVAERTARIFVLEGPQGDADIVGAYIPNPAIQAITVRSANTLSTREHSFTPTTNNATLPIVFDYNDGVIVEFDGTWGTNQSYMRSVTAGVVVCGGGSVITASTVLNEVTTGTTFALTQHFSFNETASTPGIPGLCGIGVYAENAGLRDALMFAVSYSGCRDDDYEDDDVIGKALNPFRDVTEFTFYHPMPITAMATVFPAPITKEDNYTSDDDWWVFPVVNTAGAPASYRASFTVTPVSGVTGLPLMTLYDHDGSTVLHASTSTATADLVLGAGEVRNLYLLIERNTLQQPCSSTGYNFSLLFEPL